MTLEFTLKSFDLPWLNSSMKIMPVKQQKTAQFVRFVYLNFYQAMRLLGEYYGFSTLVELGRIVSKSQFTTKADQIREVVLNFM